MFDGSGEKSPHEPKEFDPDTLGPDIPSAPEPPDAGEADSEVRGLFWQLAALANVALLAASLGIMFIGFQRAWALGTQLLLVGLVLGGYVYYRVSQFQTD